MLAMKVDYKILKIISIDKETRNLFDKLPRIYYIAINP